MFFDHEITERSTLQFRNTFSKTALFRTSVCTPKLVYCESLFKIHNIDRVSRESIYSPDVVGDDDDDDDDVGGGDVFSVVDDVVMGGGEEGEGVGWRGAATVAEGAGLAGGGGSVAQKMMIESQISSIALQFLSNTIPKETCKLFSSSA